MNDTVLYIIENIYFMPFFVGVIFVIAALTMHYFPPKKINYLYGYRTNLSMKNQEIWDFSQKYSSLKMLQSGLFLLASSFLGTVFQLEENQQLLFGIILSVAACVYLLFTTEKAIKKNFPNL